MTDSGLRWLLTVLAIALYLLLALASSSPKEIATDITAEAVQGASEAVIRAASNAPQQVSVISSNVTQQMEGMVSNATQRLNAKIDSKLAALETKFNGIVAVMSNVVVTATISNKKTEAALQAASNHTRLVTLEFEALRVANARWQSQANRIRNWMHRGIYFVGIITCIRLFGKPIGRVVAAIVLKSLVLKPRRIIGV